MCILVSRRCFYFVCWITAFQYSWKDSVDGVQFIAQSLKGPLITNRRVWSELKSISPTSRKVSTLSAQHLSSLHITTILISLFFLAFFLTNWARLFPNWLSQTISHHDFFLLPITQSSHTLTTVPGQDDASLNSVVHKVQQSDHSGCTIWAGTGE